MSYASRFDSGSHLLFFFFSFKIALLIRYIYNFITCDCILVSSLHLFIKLALSYKSVALLTAATVLHLIDLNKGQPTEPK